MQKNAVFALSKLNWQIRIKASCQQARDENNIAGIASSEFGSIGAVSAPEPPGVGKYVSVFFQDDQAERFSRDVRNESGIGQNWQLGIVSNIGDVVTLNFEGIDDIPNDLDAWLVDDVLQAAQNLREQSVYSLVPGSERRPRKLTLVVGDAAFAAAETDGLNQTPEQFALQQNFPNPFNPATTIRYSLPKSSAVTLRIYDLSGREIATLMQQAVQQAGSHAAVWNGRNAAGEPVASGIYVYRLQAGDFTQMRKMTLLR